MRVGDIGGLGSIYDEAGNIILKDEEKVVLESPQDNLLVIKGKSRLFGKTLLDMTKERGTLYLTDRRIVFLRKPDPWLKLRTYGNAFGLGTAAAEAMKARDILRHQGMQFLEVYYSEIKSFKSKTAKWADLYLEDKDGVPIRIMLDRRNRKDDKFVLLEKLLLDAGTKKIG